MVIVLEGLEGTGKTSLAIRVCKRDSYQYIKTPPPEYNSVRSFVAAQNSPDMEFYFYLSGVFAVQSKLKPFKGARQHIIVDRYIHTPIAYHARGAKFSYPAFEEARLLRADLTIHVTCNATERVQRKEQRGFHLFERAEFDDEKIESYFRAVCDVEFCNEGSLEESCSRLSRLIAARVYKES